MAFHIHSFKAMACQCEIHLPDDQNLDVHLALSLSEIFRIEQKYSRYLPDSAVSIINANAGREAAALDSETYQLLQFADLCYRISDGLFDITSGVLRRVWKFPKQGEGPAVLPTQAEIDPLLPLIDFRLVKFDAAQVQLLRPRMQLDFGGFGKEYAVDRAIAVLQQAGAQHALVNLGGDVRTLGKHEERDWQLGVQHPRRLQSSVAYLLCHAQALATSGDYERYFELDGKRYCHLLHPKTGQAIECAQSASVIASSCLTAGALSTIGMLKGVEGIDFLRRQGLPFLWIDQQGHISNN